MLSKYSTKLLNPVVCRTLQRRWQNPLSSPPTTKVTTADKIFLGGGMCLASLFIPIWVLYHVREYRGAK